MSKPYDSTLNTLIDDHLEDWAAFLAARTGVPIGPVQALDTDLATTLQADRLLQINGPSPAILHLEFETVGELGMPRRLLRYNTFTHYVHKKPVHSVVIQLRPKANASDLTGEYLVAGANGAEYLRFNYTVIRVWQESLAGLLACGPGVAPLALLTNESKSDLTGALDQCVNQLRAANLPSNVMDEVLASLFVLSGLIHDPAELERSFRNLAMTLEDSATYQMIMHRGEKQGEARGLAVGEARGLQSVLLRFGSRHYGPVTEEVQKSLLAINDHERLLRLTDRMTEVQTWDELLSTE